MKNVFVSIRPGITKSASEAYSENLIRGMNFVYSSFNNHTIQAANKKDADHSAWMRKLIFAFVVSIKPVF